MTDYDSLTHWLPSLQERLVTLIITHYSEAINKTSEKVTIPSFQEGRKIVISSEGALYVILPYDYTPTFWKHTGPWQQLEHKCFDDFDNDE